MAVAVRSSATAEDLPTASFAGQHESYLNVSGEANAVDACRRCFASIFTDRAIGYRLDNGFDHFKVALSVAVMKMVRSDHRIERRDLHARHRDRVSRRGVRHRRLWPRREYRPGQRRSRRVLCAQADLQEGISGGAGAQVGRQAAQDDIRHKRRRGSDDQEQGHVEGRAGAVLPLRPGRPALAGYAIAIEDHYSRKPGRPMPMDIEWAKDGEDGELYIVQARPETVASRRAAKTLRTTRSRDRGPVLVTGRAVGEKIATGIARVDLHPSRISTPSGPARSWWPKRRRPTGSR